MAVTLDRVRDIVLDCLRRGEAPSQRAVRKALGGGSPNEIGPLVREVMFELAGRPSTVSAVPVSVTQATEALWQLALAQAHQSLDAEREQAQLAVVSWKTQADHFSALAETHAGQLKAALADAEKLRAEHTAARADWQLQLQALTRDHESLRRDLAEAQVAMKQLRDECERLTAAVKTQQAELEQRAIALAESRGAMSQAQARLTELATAFAHEQARCQQLLIDAAQQSLQLKQLREQLELSEQQRASLKAALSAAQVEIASVRQLAQTLDEIAALAQPVATKSNQPARLRIDGVNAQMALARLLAGRGLR